MTKADAGQRLSTEFGHQPVVPAAAAHPGLRTQPRVHELEGRSRVVVQPAHHAWVQHVRHTQRVENGPDLLEVFAAGVAEVIDHQRRVGQQRLHRRSLVVQHPERVEFRALPGRLVQVQGPARKAVSRSR